MNIYTIALTLTFVLFTVVMQLSEDSSIDHEPVHDSYDYDRDVDWIPMAQGI